MERPIFQPVGTGVEDLDTPALVVDLDVMERNIEILHSYFRRSDAKVRPNLSAHQCPQIGHRQLEAGGTVGGIAVTTVGEAEVFYKRRLQRRLGGQSGGDPFQDHPLVQPG